MSQLVKEIEIKSTNGLHARPAALFVQIVNKYNATVTISKDSDKVSGKSIMGILTLGAQKGSVVKLEIEGEDAQQAMDDLEELLLKEDGI